MSDFELAVAKILVEAVDHTAEGLGHSADSVEKQAASTSSAVGKSFNGVFDHIASESGPAFSHVQNDMKETGRESGELGEKFGDVNSKSSQTAGAMGDLGGALAQAGGPVGALGTGMSMLAPSIMGLAGVTDLLEVATSTLSFTNLKAKASSIGSAIATGAQTVATNIATGAQWAFNAAMDANPIAIVVIALAALVGGLILAYTKVGWFRDFVNSCFAAIKAAGVQIVSFFTKDIPAGFNVVLDFLKKWGVYILLPFAPFIALPIIIIQHWGAITDFFSSLGGKIQGFFKSAATWLTTAGANILRGLMSGVTLIWNNTVVPWFNLQLKIAKFVAGAGSWLTSAGGSIISGLFSSASSAWNSGVGVFSNVKGKITGFFSGSGTWLSDIGKGIINGFWTGLKTVGSGALDIGKDVENAVNSALGLPKSIGGWKLSAGPFHYTLPTFTIPAFAEGGLFSGMGTGTSDSNLAALSNGEFVVNARATASNRALLEAINSGQSVSAAGGGTVFTGDINVCVHADDLKEMTDAIDLLNGLQMTVRSSRGASLRSNH